MNTRIHITAACLALAATLGCRSDSEDMKSDSQMSSTQNTSQSSRNSTPVAKPMDTSKQMDTSKPMDNNKSSTPAAAKSDSKHMDSKSMDTTKSMDSKSMDSTTAMESKKSTSTDMPPKTDTMKNAKLGEAAPAFALKDLDGKEHSLAQYKGKTVVLEWFNPNCPVCIGSYTDGSLKGMPERYMADGVVWLGINSGSPESKSNGDANRPFVEKHNLKAPILVDSNGAVGMAYGAKTTPHMYVIDQKGVLVYAGAIDNQKEEGASMVNYVDAAMADMKAGTAVKIKETKPYGCSVKYAKPQ